MKGILFLLLALPLLAAAADRQVINIGQSDNDGTGDPRRVLAQKSNANFAELFSRSALLTSNGIPTSANAAAWRKALGLNDSISLDAYNAAGDGTTDDTAAIQAAITAGVSSNKAVILPAKSYLVGQLNIPAGAQLISQGATLKMRALVGEETGCLYLLDSSNVSVTGPLTINGQSSLQDQPTVMGVYVIGNCTNVVFDDLTIYDCATDGLYIGNNGTPRDITVRRINVSGCWRNNISVTSGQDVTFGVVVTTAAHGTAPGCGIDIEPNYSSDVLKNIHFDSVTAVGNEGSGIQVLGQMSGTNWVHGGITFGSLICRSNTFNGIGLHGVENVTISKFDSAWNNNGLAVDGDTRNVSVTGNFHHNRYTGIYLLSESNEANGTYGLQFAGAVYNNSQLSAGSSDGLVVSTNGGKRVSDIMFTGSVFDDQVTPTQRYGVRISPGVESTGLQLLSSGGHVVEDILDAGTNTRITTRDGITRIPTAYIRSLSVGTNAPPGDTFRVSSATYGIQRIDGGSQAGIRLMHTGALTNLQAALIATKDGATYIDSLNDDGTTQRPRLIWLDHVNGTVSFANDKAYIDNIGDLVLSGYVQWPNNTWAYGRNSTNTGNLPIIGLDSADQVRISPSGNLTYVAGSLTVATNLLGQNLRMTGNGDGVAVTWQDSTTERNTNLSSGKRYFQHADVIFQDPNNSYRVQAELDDNTTSGETPLLLLDITAGTAKRVSIGASDSGGTGYKVLRIPN